MKEQSLDLTGQQFMLVIGQKILCMATGDTLIVMVVYCLLEDGYSGVDGSEIDDLTIDEYNEETGEETYFEPYDDNFNYVGPKVVLLNLGVV